MVRLPKGAVVLLAALLLAPAAPAATQAADPLSLGMGVAGDTPLDKNLLRNPGFEAQTATAGSVPGWEYGGGVRVERFGDRAWPYPAYGRKYLGGKQYLACRGSAGYVRQTIPFSGFTDWRHPLKAHLIVDFGGRYHDVLRVTLVASGPKGSRAMTRSKPPKVTNSYKRLVAWVVLPEGTDTLVATVELLGSRSRCSMVADTIKMAVFRPPK